MKATDFWTLLSEPENQKEYYEAFANFLLYSAGYLNQVMTHGHFGYSRFFKTIC